MPRDELLQQLVDPKSPLNIDSLLDALCALVIDCKIPVLLRMKSVNSFITKYEKLAQNLAQLRMKASDFDKLKVIGRGAFGEVQLVRHQRTNRVHAMKILNKDDMIKRSDSAFYWEERDIMAHSKSEWIVELLYAFQDARHLYMVMEWMPGGDLVHLMTNYEYDVSEKMTRFYAAEIVEALDALHSLGYIHRDVKPDNMLISISGHIKLADFGTCVKVDANGVVRCSAAVGTPDYISPEFLEKQGQEAEFGREVDWWAVGVFIYEMLFGETPFYAEALVSTYTNIMNHKTSLKFPDDREVSDEARDIIRKFLSSASERLGKNSVDDIRNHKFFQNDEWTFATLRQATPPVIPALTSDDDTKHFEELGARERDPTGDFQLPKTFNGHQLPFIGFSYLNEYSPADKLLQGYKHMKKQQQQLPTITEQPRTNGHASGVPQEQFDEVTIELDSKKRELEMLRSNIERTEIRSKMIEKEKNLLSSKIGDLERELKENKDKLRHGADSDAKVNELALDLRMSKEYNAEMESELSKFRDKCEQLKEDLRKKAGELAQEKNETQRVFQQKKDLDEILAEIKRDYELLQTVEAEKSMQLKKALDERKENGAYQQSVAKATDAEWERKMQFYEKQLEHANDERKREEQKRTAAEFDQSRVARKLAGIETNYELLQNDYKSMKEAHKDLERDLQDVIAEKRRLEIRVEQLMDSRNTDERVLSLCQDELMESQEEAKYKEDGLRGKIDGIRSELDNERMKTQTLEENLIVADKERQMLKMEVQELMQRHKWEISHKDQNLKHLENQLDEMKEQSRIESTEQESNDKKTIADLRRKLDLESAHKKAVINKLEEEIAKRHPLKKGEKGVTKSALIKKEREIMSLQQEKDAMTKRIASIYYDNEKQSEHYNLQMQEMVATIEALRDELREAREEYPNRNGGIRYDDKRSLDSREGIPTSLSHQNFQLEGWLSIRESTKKSRKPKWTNNFVVLNEHAFTIFVDEKALSVVLSIESGSMAHVRHVTAADLRNVDDNQLPKIFHIMYDDTSSNQSRHASNSDLSMFESQREESWKRHDFQELSYHIRTHCDDCGKKLSDMIRPQPAFECKNCHFKTHKEHVAQGTIPICRYTGLSRELVLMASQAEMCARWVSQLRRFIEASRPAAVSVSRVSSRRHAGGPGSSTSSSIHT